DDRRGVTGLVALRFPNDLARLFIETNDPSAIRPANTGVEELAIHYRHAIVPVTRCAGRVSFLADEHSPEVVREVRAPDKFAARGVEALQFTLARLGVNAVRVHHRRATR